MAKRALVEYASSSEDDTEMGKDTPVHGDNLRSQVKKQKRLPTLPDVISPSPPSSDPAAHQGRIRTQPHVEGQWAAYVYVPVSLSECSPGLHKLLHRLLNVACDEVPELYPFLKIGGKCTPSERNEEELHISLSRPIFLRAHQREELRKAVKGVACSSKRFQASFSHLTVFRNDEMTRTFLSLEVGAGHDGLRALSNGFIKLLTYLRQKEYYTEPRFHASIAWALLSGTTRLPHQTIDALHGDSSNAACGASAPRLDGNIPSFLGETFTPPSECTSSAFRVFPTVSCIPSDLVDRLEREYGDELRRIGRLDVDRVSVKIGKEVFTWGLCD